LYAAAHRFIPFEIDSPVPQDRSALHAPRTLFGPDLLIHAKRNLNCSEQLWIHLSWLADGRILVLASNDKGENSFSM